MSRRLRPPVRRGRFFALPLPQATPAPPPAWVPQSIASTSRKPKAPLASRRGIFFSLPRGQRVTHPGDVRQRKRLPTLRRGAFFAVPFVATIVTSSNIVSQFIQQDSSRSRYVIIRRGSFFTLVRGQVILAAPAVTQFIQQSSSRSHYVANRRGSFLYAPLGQRMPHPGIMRRQKRMLMSLKRGQFFTVPYAFVPQIAPWPPLTLRGARRPIAPIRRGVVFPVRLIGAAPVISTRGVMFGVVGSGSTMSGIIGVGSSMSGV